MKAILLLLTLTVAALAQPSAPIKDTRDGKTYRAVKIGAQVWMAENLDYAAEGSHCYNNDEMKCYEYGRLYDWETALKACPKGWHLPDTTEWNVLIDFAGGERVAGKKLKAIIGWGESFNGDDEFGFTALPGGSGEESDFYFIGFWGYTDGDFYNLGGRWWSASENNYTDGTYSFEIASIREVMDRFEKVKDGKDRWRSVRCVRD